MKEVDPGHEYLLDSYDGGEPVRLVFVKREGEGYPFNVGHHPGTNCQEVIRALIARVKYLQKQVRCDENIFVIDYLRRALWQFEVRAAQRHGRRLPDFYLNEIESQPTCAGCGHIGCKGNHKSHAAATTSPETPVGGEAISEVAQCAQAVLTALNVGDVQSGSLLHLKLREVMIAYRERAALASVAAPQPPMCAVHAALDSKDKLVLEVGNGCIACSLHERTALLNLLEPFAAADASQDSLTVLRGIIATAAASPETPVGGEAKIDFSCRVCGVQCASAPDPPARAVCPEHCEDHDYCYERNERGHYCQHCGQQAPEDWYDD